jgi:hypothetical protein
MWQDPIIAEIHKTREKISLSFGDDIHAICEAARKKEAARKMLIKSKGLESVYSLNAKNQDLVKLTYP